MPNVLIFLTDQQRYDTVRAAGYPHMITPALDALCADGTLYTNAYSSNPVCMPARHDLITGRTGRAHGYFMNAPKPIKDLSVDTLPHMFSRNGYRTAAIGKMHYFPVREHHGFGSMSLMEELPKRRADDDYAMYLKREGLDVQNLHGVRPHLYHAPQISQQDSAHHGTSWVADSAIKWLDDNAGAPFFLMCGFVHPHPPWNIPSELTRLYADAKLPKPVPRSRNIQDGNDDNAWFGDMDSPDFARAQRAAYYTAVTMIDSGVGRVVEWLKANGQYDDTLIIYTSDHGEMLRDKGYFSKELPYEGAARIPLIVKYPHTQKQARDDRLATLLDLFPTIADVCALSPAGEDLPGSVLTSGVKPEYAYSASGDGIFRWAMVRDARYKFAHFYNGGVEELFDLMFDPGETFNIISEPSAREVAERLRGVTLEKERVLGPEYAVSGDGFNDLPFEKLHPSVRGEYHLWEHRQMQAFDESYDRQHKLAREMERALSDAEFSGITKAELLHDPEWVECFMKYWRAYGNLEVDEKDIF